MDIRCLLQGTPVDTMALRPITTATATPIAPAILNVVTPMGKEVANTLSIAVVMAHIMVNNQWSECEERTPALRRVRNSFRI